MRICDTPNLSVNLLRLAVKIIIISAETLTTVYRCALNYTYLIIINIIYVTWALLLTDRCYRCSWWTMSARSSSRIKSPVGCRCHYILKRCMAIHLQKQSLVRYVPQQAETSPYWMYDNGYLIFQASTLNYKTIYSYIPYHTHNNI